MDSTAVSGAGILTCCPSATPFGLALGPTNPGRIYLPQETLGFRRAGFSPALSLLIPAFSLARAPPLLTVRLRRGVRRSSTTASRRSTASASSLFPIIYGATLLDQ